MIYIPDYESIEELINIVQFLDQNNESYLQIVNQSLYNNFDPIEKEKQLKISLSQTLGVNHN